MVVFAWVWFSTDSNLLPMFFLCVFVCVCVCVKILYNPKKNEKFLI